MTTTLLPRPPDANLSVTKAARLLGVHPNTVRAWSEQGRLRYYRINPRGDRRYRLGDLESFLAAAEAGGGNDPTTEAGRIGRRRDQGSAVSRTTARTVGDAAERDGRSRDLRAIAEIAAITSDGRDLDHVFGAAVSLIGAARGYLAVAVYELDDARLVLRAASPTGGRLGDLARSFGAAGVALDEGRAVHMRADMAGWTPLIADSAAEIAIPIIAGPTRWGVLVVASDRLDGLTESDREFLDTVARQCAVGVHSAELLGETARQVHRLEALRRVAGDVASKLDLEQTLAGVVDHGIALFAADRAAIFLRRPDGHLTADVSRGLSAGYLAAVRDFPSPSLPAASVAARTPLFATDYANDPRVGVMRAAVIQEGFDTIASAPLFDGSELLGLLCVYHDRAHPWSESELDTLATFATQASVAIKAARNYSQMATWAAQLQSIQQLGARLNRLTSVHEIGLAIATELRQLLDFHNVRVYRLYGDDLIPVAMQGQVGEYVDETPDQLRIKIGLGITGWVALHKVAQNLPDAAKDPRANTIAGTEPDLDESMLLAPMIFEDRVLGVLVLSKLGLHQFTEDDLRLLVIYASFAAQAMANADSTEALRGKTSALERQIESQRLLLQITESILTTLDARAVLDQITDRLGVVVRADNISIELVDPMSGLLRPLTAKGVHAAQFLQPWAPGEEGIATWVVTHNEPQLIVDERADPRINDFRGIPDLEASLIVVPLRGRDGAIGVLTLERLGADDRFPEAEFDLVKLFAAHVSIALQNAEAHRALAVRARTDALTGLLNHGTFQDRLAERVAAGSPFSLIMADLDDFKGVNDALGHQAGDRLLHEIATAIIGAGRESDHVFRYGGDEFTILLPGTNRNGTLRVAERVGSAVHAVGASGTGWAAAGITVSASIGLATFPEDGSTAASILLAADRACFVAKRSGQGRIATADEGRSLASEFSLQQPTPVDPPSLPV
ncbi:MAG: GAF domain-containing protein [Candidatus Limnocylindrales bacterium]